MTVAFAHTRHGEHRLTRRAALSLASLAALAVLLGYAASPYVALWRIGRAMDAHDLGSLRAAVDWTGVREGLKQEIEASLSDDPPVPAAAPGLVPLRPRSGIVAPGGIPAVREASALVSTGSRSAAAAPQAPAGDDLPDFGDSFATSAISQSVDQDCTPERLAGMLGGHRAHVSVLDAARRAIAWAFFTSPQRFEALVRPGDASARPVRVTMAFSRQHGWKVTRVWLPPEMLDPRGQQRT